MYRVIEKIIKRLNYNFAFLLRDVAWFYKIYYEFELQNPNYEILNPNISNIEKQVKTIEAMVVCIDLTKAKLLEEIDETINDHKRNGEEPSYMEYLRNTDNTINSEVSEDSEPEDTEENHENQKRCDDSKSSIEDGVSSDEE